MEDYQMQETGIDYQMQETGQNLDKGLAWALKYQNHNLDDMEKSQQDMKKELQQHQIELESKTDKTEFEAEKVRTKNAEETLENSIKENKETTDKQLTTLGLKTDEIGSEVGVTKISKVFDLPKVSGTSHSALYKVIEYPFISGEKYTINVCLTNIVADEGKTINVVLRETDSTSTALKANITNNITYEYIPSNNNDALYVDCYNGTASVSLSVTHQQSIKKDIEELNNKIDKVKIKKAVADIQLIEKDGYHLLFDFPIKQGHEYVIDVNITNSEGHKFIVLNTTDASKGVLVIKNNGAYVFTAFEDSPVVYYRMQDSSGVAHLDAKIEERTPSTACVSVASSTSNYEQKKNATFVCLGGDELRPYSGATPYDDAIVINHAIQTIPKSGGTLHLCSGVFHCHTSIIVDRHIKIEGEGHAIAGRPAYTPKSGFDYNNNIYGLKTQNLYGPVTDRATTLRGDGDINVIQIGETEKSPKLNVVMRDFLIQGYGKDRHTKCGIYGRCSTDISTFDNISVTDCYIGMYLHGDKDNSYNDALKVINSSFQWCAMGLIAYSAFGIFMNNCIADNNGIKTYTDEDGNKTNCYCGGAYFGGSTGCRVINNVFVRNTSFVLDNDEMQNPGSSVVLDASSSVFMDNIVRDSAGYGLVITGVLIEIKNNVIINYGISNHTNYKNGINESGYASFITIEGNDIGNENENKATAEYAIRCANTIFCKNNKWRYFGKNKTSRFLFVRTDRQNIISGNIYYGYESGTYTGNSDS